MVIFGGLGIQNGFRIRAVLKYNEQMRKAKSSVASRMGIVLVLIGVICVMYVIVGLVSYNMDLFYEPLKWLVGHWVYRLLECSLTVAFALFLAKPPKSKDRREVLPDAPKVRFICCARMLQPSTVTASDLSYTQQTVEGADSTNTLGDGAGEVPQVCTREPLLDAAQHTYIFNTHTYGFNTSGNTQSTNVSSRNNRPLRKSDVISPTGHRISKIRSIWTGSNLAPF